MQHPQQSVSDAAWTLQTGRTHFPYRKALILDKSWKDDSGQYMQQLKKAKIVHSPRARRPVYFMFPGRAASIKGWEPDYINRQSNQV